MTYKKGDVVRTTSKMFKLDKECVLPHLKDAWYARALYNNSWAMHAGSIVLEEDIIEVVKGPYVGAYVA